MRGLTVGAVVGLSCVLVLACGEEARDEEAARTAQGLSAPSPSKDVAACASALGPALRDLDAALAAYARAPSSATREAVEVRMTVGALSAAGSGLGAGEPRDVTHDKALTALSDDALTQALADATTLAMCKSLRATEALVSGTLESRTRDAEALGLEEARRRERGARDAGGDAASDATTDAADAGASDAATDARAGQGSGTAPCRRWVLTDDELRRLRDAPTGSRWYADGGGDLGIYWGVLGRQQPGGTAFGVFGAYREIDGECFLGIGGRFIF